MNLENLLGQKVRLELKSTSAVLHGPFASKELRTFHLEGTVIKKPHWEKDSDLFAIAIPFDDVPLRIVHIKNIVSINGKKVKMTKTSLERTWKIKSSRTNELYMVKEFDGHWSCTCVANASFNKMCKHILEAQRKEPES
jgi:hypothetical protein